MALWVLKGGSRGEFEARMLENSVLAIGWFRMTDLSNLRDREDFEKVYRTTYPDASDGRVAIHVGQLYAFVRTAKVGDLVVVPLKTRSAIAIGEITGDYQYREDLGPDLRHTRSVQFRATDLPRTSFDQDLLYTFGAFMTFCRAERNNAEARVKAVLAGQPERARKPPLTPDATADPLAYRDVERDARDEILEHIRRKFKGHDLANLVNAVLKAQGLLTKVSDPGPDGGVDILAASGPMGFDSPRLCVQVKSSDSPTDVSVFRGLKGTMDSFDAEQGLLVSWSGFKDSVVKEARGSFFRVRLWNSDDLLEQLFWNYERLPEDVRAALPLKRIWALAREEPGE
jgi:restriction system protein